MSQAKQKRSRNEFLGELLVSSGRITGDQLDRALALRKSQGLKTGQALVELGLLSESELSGALKKQGKMQCINLTPEIVDHFAAEQLDHELCRRFRAVVVNRIAGVNTVAMVDPTDLYLVDEISLLLKTEVLPVYAEPSLVVKCLDHIFGADDAKDDLEEIAETLDIEAAEISSEDFDVTGDKSLDRPVVNMVWRLLRDAYDARASDIHFEPRGANFMVRFRVDGRCHDRLCLSKEWARPCVARLKVLGQLDLAQSRLPQDGRAQVKLLGKPVDLRIATTPTVLGEGAVIRILDGGREVRSLTSLDLEKSQVDSLYRMIDVQDGMVLVTGPTGSGKTTTLYALLQELNAPHRKIITLEDPVENQLDGVTQIAVNNKVGLTFSRGLRSILRQDPDTVLVGEIRDEETARIGIQAALTGHLMLSTLHTRGTVESITRLRDMGIESYLLADTLRGIVAQRLVRRTCINCKMPAEVPFESLQALGMDLKEGDLLCEGTGCDSCHDTGYKGRVAVLEILHMTQEVCNRVRQNQASERIEELAVASGMHTLRMDAIQKVRAGITTVSEALSLVGRNEKQ